MTDVIKDLDESSESDGKQGKSLLKSWLNKNFKVEMSDGRILIGVFICTDKDCNVILGSCVEFLNRADEDEKEIPRILGLAMIPGHHIVKIELDQSQQ